MVSRGLRQALNWVPIVQRGVGEVFPQWLNLAFDLDRVLEHSHLLVENIYIYVSEICRNKGSLLFYNFI